MKNRNRFWGLLFILIAILIVLSQLNLLVGVSIFNLIITVLMIPIIITSIRYLNFGGILFPLAIIGILYDKQLGIEAFTPWPILGIALFLSIGLSIIIPHKKYYTYQKRTGFENVEAEHLDDGVVEIYSKLTSGIKYIDSTNLKRVDVYASCSGCKIYFDHAEISGDEAVINIEASCAGVELFIPRNWKLEDKLNCVLGGIEEKGRPLIEKDSKKIILNGRASLSGIVITYI